MQLGLLVGETRLLIGSPSVNAVPDREILSFLIPSIQLLAGYLEFDVVTDQSIGLVADQREYPLPLTCLYFVWVQVNGALLDPSTVWVLNSGGNTVSGSTTSTTPNVAGQSWMTIPSGTPAAYAVQGRQLILYPPASAAFVASTPTMSWRYISCGAWLTNQGSVGLTAQGIPTLTDLDLAVVRLDAAKAWLGVHMLGLPQDQLMAQQATIADYQQQIDKRLPECKRRWETMVLDDHRTMRVEVGGRYGAAR